MPVIFSFPGFEAIARYIASDLAMTRGDVTIRHFPDGETYVRLNSPVEDQDVIIVCGLDNPDQKIMGLMFFAQVARDMGAKSIGLVAPYLGYMRQDKRFQDGEAVTADLFAAFLSDMLDWLITVDPHLHRHESLSEIYSIPATVLHISELMAAWIKFNISKPLLIGPDEESAQWVSDVAQKAGAPYMVLTKIRHGDRDVDVSLPDVTAYHDYTPVLIDDIISTARTMIETVGHLKTLKMKPPICIAIHAIFAGEAYENLTACGAQKIVTSNSILHHSNGIAIEDMLSKAVGLLKLMGPDPKVARKSKGLH